MGDATNALCVERLSCFAVVCLFVFSFWRQSQWQLGQLLSRPEACFSRILFHGSHGGSLVICCRVRKYVFLRCSSHGSHGRSLVNYCRVCVFPPPFSTWQSRWQLGLLLSCSEADTEA